MACARLILLFLLTTTSLAVLWLHPNVDAAGGDDICTSIECKQVAQDILQDLHPDYVNIDPCHDFHSQVCGGFEEKHKDDRGYVNQLTLMDREVMSTLHNVLEQNPSRIAPEDENLFAKMQSSFVSCMDMHKLRQIGLKPLEKMAERIKSLASIQPSDLQDSSDLQKPWAYSKPLNPLTKTFLFLLKSGIQTLVALDIQADDKAPDTQTVVVWPAPNVGLPALSFYNDVETLKAYKNVTKNVLANFYTEVETFPLLGEHNDAWDLVDGVLDLEKHIAEAVPPLAELLDVHKTYNILDLRELEKAIPELSIANVIDSLSPNRVKLKSVIVRSPSFLRSLSKILASTPPDVITAFLVWRTIQSYSVRIEDPALLPLKRFNNMLGGRPENATEERWKKCVRDTDADLPWVVSKFYVQASFPPTSKDFGNHIINDIKNSFAALLTKVTWMASEDRAVARRKALSITQKVGYPTKNPNLLDSHSLENYYHGLHISRITYFENKARAAQFETELEWSKLGKPTQHDDFAMTSTTVTANYMANRNEIGFPAAYLQPPVLYAPKIPGYLSYGAMGSIGGHELSHGFDPSGSQYDYKGKLRDWWSNTTRQAFNNKTKCFIDQYSNYSVPYSNGKYKVNGSLTLGENIADAGGVHAAWSAWRRIEEASPGQLIPGLEHFTKEQLFFVAWGRSWCSKATGEEFYTRMQMNAHAPEPVRLMASMDNSAAFKEAFRCVGRIPTCELW